MSTIKQPQYDAKAQAMWNVMSSNERTGIRFGLFSGAAMEAAAKEGYDEKQLSLALMRVAENSGGMVS